jgi:hypothetical protein
MDASRKEIVELLARAIMRKARQRRLIKPPQNVPDSSDNCLESGGQTPLSVHSGLHPENLGEPK